MKDPIAEIIIPTFAHPLLLPHSLDSARAQTVDNIMIHVVGDGTCESTRSLVADRMETDPRIVFHDHPKSARTGEEYRHSIVSASRARFITYLGDDDLMAPDHVQTMSDALRSADVAFPPHTRRTVAGETIVETYSLEEEFWRNVASGGTGLFSLSGMAHTVSYYRSLPKGWESTPPGYHTDQYMILKFIDRPGTRFVLTATPTVIHLPSTERRHMSTEDRQTELSLLVQRFETLGDWFEYRQDIFARVIRIADERQRQLISLAQQHEQVLAAFETERELSANLRASIDQIESARIIKLRNRLLRFGLVRWLVRRRS